MPKQIDAILAKMERSPSAVDYDDLKNVCEHYFGSPRQKGTSHCVFKTPWQGNPRVNIQQGSDGNAKSYQVRQVLKAIRKLLEHDRENEDDS
ncbi:hypothetical protein [Insolitispirillum peregrinum]|uniref:hypothetical protein n=1 Tax=Insolitispirillum peregrinum TaxID=80876 RepID=UPI003612CE99